MIKIPRRDHPAELISVFCSRRHLHGRCFGFLWTRHLRLVSTPTMS